MPGIGIGMSVGGGSLGVFELPPLAYVSSYLTDTQIYLQFNRPVVINAGFTEADVSVVGGFGSAFNGQVASVFYENNTAIVSLNGTVYNDEDFVVSLPTDMFIATDNTTNAVVGDQPVTNASSLGVLYRISSPKGLWDFTALRADGHLWQDLAETIPALLNGDPIASAYDPLTTLTLTADAGHEPLLYSEGGGVWSVEVDGNEWFNYPAGQFANTDDEQWMAMRLMFLGGDPDFGLHGISDSDDVQAYAFSGAIYETFAASNRQSFSYSGNLYDYRSYEVQNSFSSWEAFLDANSEHTASTGVTDQLTGSLIFSVQGFPYYRWVGRASVMLFSTNVPTGVNLTAIRDFMASR